MAEVTSLYPFPMDEVPRRVDFKVARWNYCRLTTNETRQPREVVLEKYLKMGNSGTEQEKAEYKDKCKEK